MQFNVSQLLREHVGATRAYELAGDPPVHRGSVRMLRTPEGVLVSVEADVLLEADCSRCVAPFAYPVHLEFDEMFFPQVDLVTGEHLAPRGEEEGFAIDERHTIDITEAVRQYSEVAAELQPLCRADCPGLCPVCGKDLSLESCACERERTDPRWSALAGLKSLNG